MLQRLCIPDQAQQRGTCVCSAALCVQHMLHATKKCQKNGQDAMSTVFQLPRVRTAGVGQDCAKQETMQPGDIPGENCAPKIAGPDAVLVCMAFLCLYAAVGQTSVISLICWAI